MAVSTRVLLRQVLFNHGQHIPQVRIGSADPWLSLVPDKAVSSNFDRRTVVLPRPGDGWYATPASSGGFDGYPWGDLSAAGATTMSAAGRALMRAEKRPCGAARDVDEKAVSRPGRRNLDDITVRCLNTQKNVMSAQGLVAGAQEFLQEESGARQGPTEVLLGGGEDLMAQLNPTTADYPRLPHASDAKVGDLMAPMVSQFLEVASSLQSQSAELVQLIQQDFSQAFDVLLSLESHGFLQGSRSGTLEKVDALKRFQFMRWAAPLHAGGPEAASEVVGPLLQELFRACEAAGESPAAADEPVPLIVYVSHAPALAALLTSFGLTSGGTGSSVGKSQTWPSFGSSLELILLHDGQGELFLQFIHDGEVYVPGLGRDILPYDSVRQRFQHLD